MQDPGGSEDFKYGGWVFEIERGEEGDRFKYDEVLDSEAFLLGRVTYDGFAEAWPQRDGDFADRFNAVPKYVVGSKADASRWTNTTVLDGDPVEAAKRVRDEHSGNIYVHGSRQLAQTLFEHDLVDQLNLMVFPVVLGTGKRMFDETGDKKKSAARRLEGRRRRRRDPHLRAGGRGHRLGEVVHYEQFTKRLATPAGFRAPERLLFDHFDARAISGADLTEDVRGINSGLDLIARTRGGGWPTEPVTAAVDFVDLVWHELEFRDGYSFTYAVYDTGGKYLGCCYLYPLGRRTELSEGLLDYDVDVSWWVTLPPTSAATRSCTPPSGTGWPLSSHSGARTTQTGKSLVELSIGARTARNALARARICLVRAARPGIRGGGVSYRCRTWPFGSEATRLRSARDPVAGPEAITAPRR